MHPAIKIVSLVIATIFLTQGNWYTILLTGALLLPFYFVLGNLWHSALRMIARLKWFFISILLIYYIYTPYIPPAEPVFFLQFIQRNIPGLFRISILIIILLSVNLFIKTTTKEEILSALLWISSPLKYFNLETERLSLRAVLTIEYIEVLSNRLALYKKKKALDLEENKRIGGMFSKIYSRIKHIKIAFLHLIEHSGIILREILKEAESTSGRSYSIECLEPPTIFQYFFPVSLWLFYALTL